MFRIRTAEKPLCKEFRTAVTGSIFAVVVVIAGIQPTHARDAQQFFEEQIRPILVNRCYECHSAVKSAPAANLRLDSRAGWLAGGDSGPAIDTTDPAESLLLKAVSYDDPDLQMPPRSKLTEREIMVLRQWILAGAVGPDEATLSANELGDFDLAARRESHWVWRPVMRPTVPLLADKAWPQAELDCFVLARLESAGLLPAEPATRETWLRRVTFDLIGLPPSVEDIHSFLQDDNAQSYERVVDRLLASPAFGECWGQHWLDLVRYADTKGHEQDFPIPHAWRYRDYVIRALNDGVPYDQFVIEHIAGDLLANPRIDASTRTNQSVQATGFWHLGEATHSPVDIRGDEADRVDNQIDVFGKAFLGLTIACARCHEHKFDAISTEDYYALCGYLQSSSYQEVNVSDPELRGRLRDDLRRVNHVTTHALLEEVRNALSSQLRALLEELCRSAQSFESALAEALSDRTHPLYLLATAVEAERRGGDVGNTLSDVMSPTPASASATRPLKGQRVIDFEIAGRQLAYADWRTSGLAFGDGPVRAGQLVLDIADDEPLLRAVERAAAANTLLSPRFTGMYRTRTFEITTPSVWYCYRGEADVFLAVDSHRTVAGPLHAVCRQKLEPAQDWTWQKHEVGDYLGHRVHVEFTPRQSFSLASVYCVDRHPRWDLPINSTIAQVFKKRKPRTVSEVADCTWEACADAVERVRSETAIVDDAKLFNWLLSNEYLLPSIPSADLEAYSSLLQRYKARRAGIESQIPTPQFALALLDGSGENERVHLRGSHKRVANEPTRRRFLAALGEQAQEYEGSGRTHLARRMVNPENPLTARVFVNRVWSHLFGRGIVPTVDNFGVLGEPPSHPNLLDYLAAEFVDSGWDVKGLIRRLVLSSTYRQSCIPNRRLQRGEIARIDPDNRLLHRAQVHRIPAEAIRDALLFVSSGIDDTQCGPGVPIHITAFMRHNRSPETNGPVDGQRRRSIYLEVRRNALSHFLTAFDKPQPFTTVGRRTESNSPAQPLMLLNDPLVHLLAKEWGAQLAKRFSNDDLAVGHAYLAAFGRAPTARERAAATAFVRDRMVGCSSVHDSCNEERELAWQDLCLALVNAKEFIHLR